MPPDSENTAPEESFDCLPAREKVRHLESLRHAQIRKLLDLVNDGTSRPGHLPAVNSTGASIAAISEAISVYKEEREKSHFRFFGIIATSSILLVLGTVLLLPIPKTPVFLTTKSNTLSFTLLRNAALLRGAQPASEVKLLGVSRVFMGNAELPPPAGQQFHLLGTGQLGHIGQIGLESLELPEGTGVSILSAGSLHQLQMALVLPQEALGPLKLNLSGSFTHPPSMKLVTLSQAVQLEAIPAGQHILLTLIFPNTQVRFDTPLHVGQMSWSSPSPTATEESSMVSGTVYFDDIRTLSAKLRPGTPFRVAGSGYIRKLVWNAGLIDTEMEGTATSVSTGTEETRRDLMPSIFSYIRTRETLTQFWAALGSLTLLALALDRWWRSPQ